MRTMWTLAGAIARGFVRDRMSNFFVLLFPVMFLFFFGSVFASDEPSRSTLVVVGDVSLVDDMPAGARAAFTQSFDVEHTDDRRAAVAEVRAGDADAAVEQRGDVLRLHFSQTDQVQSATVRGTMSALVQSANMAATGQSPRYRLQTQQVEDATLEPIQYFAPGLLGWAVAMSASFGAALTLVGWRTSKLLRRLRLAPVPTGALVSARIVVSLGVAGVQTALFIVLGVGFLGLQLNGAWWMSLPLVAAGTLAFMAIGLLAGAVSKTAEAASGLANLVVLPMAFLSGSFIPLDVAPQWLQTVSLVMPLRYLNEGVIDVMVRGQGPASALMPMAVLLGFAAVVGLLATRLFRWESY